MHKNVSLLICSLLVCSCSSHSGRLVREHDVTLIAGTVPHRAGTVPYRNQGGDAKVAARKNNALKRIAKFCGAEGYTVSREGISSAAPNMSEVDFRCGEESTASAATATLARSTTSGTPGVAPAIPNPNVEPAPSEFYGR